MRIVLAVATLAVLRYTCEAPPGCDGSRSRSCVFEDVLARDVPASAMQCGSLAIDATDAERMAARDCVTAAIGTNRELVVSFALMGIDSRVARAYYGVLDGGALQLRSVFYDGDPGGGGGDNRPSTTTSSCISLATTATCTSDDLRTTLCLQCVQPAVFDSCSSR